MSQLALCLLGPPRLEQDGEPIRIRRRKTAALLAYLAVTGPGHSHSREGLVTLLSPEMETSRARAELRRCLSELNRTLGAEWLEADRETVVLGPMQPDRSSISNGRAVELSEQSLSVDVNRFRQHLATCEAHDHVEAEVCADCLPHLEAAVELYGGEFMAGFALRDSLAFDDWQRSQSEALCAALASALERLARWHGSQGEFERSLPYARRWLDLDPLHEPAHRQLMALYAWSGQRSAALRQYADCERYLQEELGVSPEEETRRLYESIKTEETPPSSGFASQREVSSTDPLQGRYVLETTLGEGGMGTVYRAYDTLLERQVAIKVLHKADLLGSDGRAHLMREAQMAAKLNHPNIVTIYDVGETARSKEPNGGALPFAVAREEAEQATPFIVMELVQGRSLDIQSPRAIDDILSIARQMCAALDHAHTHGIVHRDLKPENVLLASDGTAKLTDFGLARSAASRLTGEGTISGTAFYLAPELALGQAFDGRADLYALGVMLYELTTGRLPFTSDDPVAVISQHLHAPVVPPRARNAHIPVALDGLILRLLSKDPRDRPATAADVLQILDAPHLLDREAPSCPEPSVLQRIERGRLVAREGELRVARTLWGQVLSGQGRVLLISGEPGVGKSRLTRELATHVQVSGGRALLGACYAEGGAAYAPFATILRRVVDDGLFRELFRATEFPTQSKTEIPVDSLPDFVLADLCTLSTAVRARYPDLKPNPILNDPQSKQHRLAESVTLFINALSQRAPLLLVVEDLQWADSGTLFLLRHLARQTRRRRVMIAVTHHDVGLDETRPFQDLLIDLNRERLVTTIELQRLNPAETETLLAILLDEEITPEFLDTIYQETEGNPFFIEEVCKALVESGQLTYRDGRWQRPSIEELGVPHGVRMAVQARVRVLPPDVQEVLRLAAVLGRQFDFDTLAEAGDMGEDILIDALLGAERAQLIEEVQGEGGECFSFVHALIASTLVESLSTLQLRRLHLRVAQAIEALRPDDSEALAYHWGRTSNAEKASRYMVLAGQRAARQHANQEALEHFQGALDRCAPGEVYDRVLAQRAQILLDVYRGEEAARDYERLLESAREAEDRSAELDALLGLARANWIIDFDAEDAGFRNRSRGLYQSASDLARELGDKRSLVQALLATTWFIDLGLVWSDEHDAAFREAFVLSQEIGDEGLIVDCIMATFKKQPAKWAEEGEKLLKRLESRHDLARLNQTYDRLMWSHFWSGNLKRCVECCDAGIRLASEIGALPVQYPTYKALALMNLGRYDAAWESLQQEVADATHPFGSAFKEFGTGVFLAELMAYERASEVFGDVVRRMERLRRPWAQMWAQAALAQSLSRTASTDEETLHRVAQDLEGLSAPDSIAKGGIPSSALGEIALYLGGADEALRQADVACARTAESSYRTAYVPAVELRLRALLELDRPQDVVEQANATIEMADAMGYRPMLWRLRATKARALEMLGEAEAAKREYTAVAEIIQKLADTIPDPGLRRGFLADMVVSSLMSGSSIGLN